MVLTDFLGKKIIISSAALNSPNPTIHCYTYRSTYSYVWYLCLARLHLAREMPPHGRQPSVPKQSGWPCFPVGWDLKEGHVFVSLRRRGATLSKCRTASQGHSESCHNVRKDATGKIRLPEQGLQQVFPSSWARTEGMTDPGDSAGLSWEAGSSSSLPQRQNYSSALVPVRTACSWCIEAIWWAGFHGTQSPLEVPQCLIKGGRWKRNLFLTLEEKKRIPSGTGE